MRMKKLFISLVLSLGLTLALLWLLGGGLTVVRAADFTVDVTNDENDGSCAAGDCSLREAIIAANGNGQADTIILGSGTYALTLTGTGEDAAATGDLDITEAVTITGAGPSQTTIDASGLISDRVFDLRSGAGTVVISGVMIINGNITGTGGGIYNQDADLTLINTVVVSNTASGYGGGVYVDQGSATLSGGQILSNTAYYGGGVYVYSSSGVFAQTGDSIIAYNTGTAGGGGVYIWDGSATLSGGQVLSNRADYGGGVYVVRNAVFTQTGDSIIAYNASDWGGGVNVGAGSAMLSGAQVISNTADDQGGGVYVYQGSATLTGVQVISNTASDEGGGIYNNDGTLTLVNTTVSRNTAGDQGGGLYHYNGTSVLTYTTVASNTASWNGGIRYSLGGTILLKNTIVAYNSPGNCGGTLTSNGHNLDSGSTCGFAATGDQQNTDPLLGPLADNGGDTLTHALLEGSPAFNAGVCVAGITTDQRGVTRPQVGKCDIGAYEVEGEEVYLPLIMRSYP